MMSIMSQMFEVESVPSFKPLFAVNKVACRRCEHYKDQLEFYDSIELSYTWRT